MRSISNCFKFRFLNIFVSEYKQSLSRYAKDRYSQGPKKTELNLTYGIEFNIVNLLKQELELKKNIQIHLSELLKKPDFALKNVFEMLDNFKLGYIKEDK